MNSGAILLALVGAGIGGGLGGLLGMVFNMLRGKPSPVGGVLAVVLGLIGAGVATVTLPSRPAAMEAQLDAAGPAFQAIHRYYPAVFAQMAADAKTVDPKDSLALQNKIRPQLSALVAAHRGEIDDTSADALGRLMLDETQALLTRNPQACVAVLGGGPAGLDMGEALPTDLARRDGEVTAEILTQVATRPAPSPPKLSDAETGTLVAAALTDLSADERQLVAPLMQARKAPVGAAAARAYCAFYRNLLTTALRGPDQTLRRFLTH
ncbi:MAG TPA: hypothetical protein VGC92_07305 [Phenylobacterium sp.]|jgi:hypothetical protein